MSAISVGCVSTFFCGKQATIVSAVNAYSNGDINGDSSIDISDVILLVRYLEGEFLLNANAQEAADTYSNNVIDSVDEQVLLSYIAKTISILPYSP
jgi:hypothetical protein